MNSSAGTKRLRTLAGLALFLPCLSYVNHILVAGMNAALHRQRGDSLGWWLYAAVRLCLFVLLLRSIFQLREEPKADRPLRASREAGRWFDPLMGWRAMAAVMVVLGHEYLTAFTPSTGQSQLEDFLLTFARSNPWAGVWMFFTLSGYLMGKGFSTGRYTYTEGSVRAFLRNRFLRIVPLYVTATFLFALLSSPRLLLPGNWWQLILMLGFDYNGDLPLNAAPVLWSVSTEMQFYLLCPALSVFLLRLRQQTGKLFPLLPLLLFTGLSMYRWQVLHLVDHHKYLFGRDVWLRLVYTPLLTNLDIFVAGMSLALMERGKTARPPSRQTRLVRWVALPIAMYLIDASIAPGVLNKPFIYVLVQWITVGASLAFISMTHNAGRVPINSMARRLTLPAVQRVGVLTYAIYVCHSTVMFALRKLFHEPLVSFRTSTLMLVPVLVLTFAAATILYELIEKPFERRKAAASG